MAHQINKTTLQKSQQLQQQLKLLCVVAYIFTTLIQGVLTQSVEVRAVSDKTDASANGGQSRTIYSQKHLSPHRMMHFGKRPLVAAPPSIYLPPLVPPPPQQFGMSSLADLPVYHLSTPQQQQLLSPFRSALLGDVSSNQLDFSGQFASQPMPPRHQQLLDVVANLLELSRQQQIKECARQQEKLKQQLQKQQQQQPMSGLKFLKMVEKVDGSGGDETDSEVKQQDEKRSGVSEQAQGAIGGQDQSSINVEGRSSFSPSIGGDAAGLSRAQLSSLLFGRQVDEPSGGSDQSDFGMPNEFAKKAEPKKMTIMHFG